MATSTHPPGRRSRLPMATAEPPGVPAATATRRRRLDGPNHVAGAFAVLWLVLTAGPIVLMVSWSLQRRQDYQANGPLAPPTDITFSNVADVWNAGFATFMWNTALVTVGSIALTLLLALPAAYAIVRSHSWAASGAFRVFLLGLAIPAQATIIPVYWIMDQLDLFDTLTAIVLPTVAFGLPLIILILAGALRDITPDLYEAMTVDGAGAFRIFLQLVLPLSRGAISTVAIFTGTGAWNGFIFPLILVSDESKRVVTLGLWVFQGQFAVNIPGLMMAVIVSTLPIFLLYLFARRWLVAGLAGVGGR